MLLPQRREMQRKDCLIKTSDLKEWLHRRLVQRDKLLLVLASFSSPCQIQDIKERAREAGFRIPKSWNPSNSLSRTKGLAIRTPQGWEITETGKQQLRNLGVTRISPATVQVATDLRLELKKIRNNDTRFFVEEAIKCYEAELYRSAVVMSWTAAVAVLHQQIHAKHLSAFNAEAKRVDPSWKEAKTTDDLGRMRESKFLECIAAISLIGKDVKKELQGCLDRRNSCSHPNSYRIAANTTAHHIETLILNVFQKFFLTRHGVE